MLGQAMIFRGGVPLQEALSQGELTVLALGALHVGIPPEVVTRTLLVSRSPILPQRPPPRGFTWHTHIHLHAVVDRLPGCERLGVILHELVHRWQWDRGDLSPAAYAGEALGQMVNHDDTNRFERQAYAAQDMFMARCREVR